jgi:hypothetical protein
MIYEFDPKQLTIPLSRLEDDTVAALQVRYLDHLIFMEAFYTDVSVKCASMDDDAYTPYALLFYEISEHLAAERKIVEERVANKKPLIDKTIFNFYQLNLEILHPEWVDIFHHKMMSQPYSAQLVRDTSAEYWSNKGVTERDDMFDSAFGIKHKDKKTTKKDDVKLDGPLSDAFKC